MDEVHCPNIIRPDRLCTVGAKFCINPTFRGLIFELHPQLLVYSIDFLDVDAPAFAVQKNMNAPVAIAHTGLTYFLDPFLN